MSRTGYKIEVYMDANPYSPTYGQERTDRILDTEECTTQQPANYVHVYTYCEMNPNGSYTGNCVQVFEDVEPLSPTYGQQMEQVSADGVLCPPDSADADWQTIDTYCEQIEYQPSGKLGNSGYMVTVQQDMGEYSPTHGQTRENKAQDVVHCPLPDTSDVWVEVRRVCHLENGYQDGTVDIYKVNTNEYSPNYDFGAEVVFNEPDPVNCPASQYAPDWVETSYVCETENGYNTGNVIITETDQNPNSSTYNQTRTRTEADSTRCPYEAASLISWRIINNRGVTTDTITSITLNFNSGFSITASGNLAPVGGTMSGATVIPNGLKSTALTVQSITLSPNTSLPVIYQYSQTPSPYTWTTDGSGTLLITLWDGDGTGPEWTEVSYVCETVSGYRTGASIITEEDMNPDSATYGETRTRTVENDSRCPAQTDGDWVETSWSCQQENGYNTGYVISVQTDQNPNSSTYNTTRTRLIYDTTRCPISTTAGWTEVSYVCEKVDGKYNTGTIIITEEDMNPGSATYGQTRTRTTTGDSRCVRNESPDWVEESSVCEQDTPPTPPTPSYDFKVKTTSSGGTDTTVACDSSTTLASSEITDRNCVSAIVGDCVSTIGYAAFGNCTSLTSATISDSVTSIVNYAFNGCTNLTSVNIPSGVTELYSTFRNCSSLASITIPNGVTDLYDTFNGCSSLTSVTVPSTVTSIGMDTFYNCTGLTGITILATTPPQLDSTRAFANTNNCPIYVPAASVSAYQSASGWSTYASRITAIPT